MQKISKQNINDYNVPNYILEILINNYCPSFLRMSIIKENDSYRFSYYTDILKQIDYNNMSTANKLNLVKSIITLCKLADDYLIQTERYVIEPELIYSKNNKTAADTIKIMFYPDMERRPMSVKIGDFAERLKDKYNRQEAEVLDALAKMAGNGEWIKVERFIEKNIERLLN